MKVVNICLTGPYSDGWNYQDNLLAKYQHCNGHDVTVIAPRWAWNSRGQLETVDNTEYVDGNGVSILRLSMKGKENIQNRAKRYQGLEEALEKLGPDVIFLHGCQFLDAKTIVSYVKRHPVKLYVDNHADFSNSARNFLSKAVLHKIIWRHFAQLLLPYTEKFYGVLPARVDFLTEMYGIPRDRCELLVMGADDELVASAGNGTHRRQFREKHLVGVSDFLLITGGKIDPAKKQTLLLMDAVNRLNRPDVKLIVFGSVVDELKNELLAKCSDRVRYIGWIDSEESYNVFSAADLAVFPGRHSVFWEQCAGQGIPMVIKSWPGTHHVDLDGNVRFLYGDSIDETCDVLRSIIDRPEEYARMKYIAQTKGMSEFSYKAIAKRSIEP